MTDAERKYLYDSVGDQIRQFRKESGFSQADLAVKLDKSRVSIVNIEKGRQHPTLHLLIDLARIFNVKLDNFLPLNAFNNSGERKVKSRVNRALKKTTSTSGEEIDPIKIINFITKGIEPNKS